ncbi:MAG: 16S rRNA (cytidine(1402)-2'-O)-methyltransferase [bacterium]|nr:16S rRNA (cytidine(1402)-2'-O)-methyltransferase [bacterium]
MMKSDGILYVVATPIGNMEDITLRALRTLKEADIILCEDTRVTKRILDRYEIKDKKLSVWNEERSGVSADKVTEWLGEGKKIALVTDAGTPGISDPGGKLLISIKESLPEVKIEAIPGPSALTSALSVAGIPLHDFVFLGFLPHKKGRETIFKEIATAKRPYVFYESPHRILKALESLKKFSPEKKITICRELTKIHEEVVSGTANELLEYFENNKEKVRGEFVVIISDL